MSRVPLSFFKREVSPKVPLDFFYTPPAPPDTTIPVEVFVEYFTAAA